ncbi:MAG: hypothetical protein WC848_03695 [Parcubacteria group bacterium]|jgi:hypothetical protein
MQKYFEKIKTWGRIHWPIWVLLLISAVVYHQWLSFGIFSHADYWFWFSESSRDFLHYSAWDSQISLGGSNLFIWMWAWKIFPAFFGAFGLDSNVADKFVIFWPFAFLTPLCSYLFAKQVLQNKFGAFVAALVFSCNTYYLAINTQGHFSLTLAGTFAPLAMFFFWRYFDTGRWKNLIASALVCVVVGGHDFRVFYILFFIILAVPFWFLFMQKGRERKKLFFRQNFLALALFFSLILLLNLFWLMPTAVTGSLAGNDILARGLVGNNYSLDLGEALTLFHPFWNGGEPKWFDTQKIPIYFWLIPLMALLGAYWQRKNKKIVFWFFVALVAVFLSKQDALPLKSAYVWLHQHFPGFNAFREASKFYFAIALAYAILIGAFVSYLFENFAQKKFLKYFVFFGASLVFLLNVRPILTGEMFTIFTPQKMAGDEVKIRDYTFLQTGSFRTLWNPSDSMWASFSSYRPKINEIETRRDFWKKIKDYADAQGGEPSGNEKNQLFFSENFATRLLSQSAVRYLVSDQANFYMVKNLVANPEWKKLDLGLGEKTIFENETARPRIYLTDEPETIHREITFAPVDYSLENSAHWDFRLKNFDGPVRVNFAEKYHPDWQVVCGNTPWYALLGKKAILPVENHKMTDAGLNAFLIYPREIADACAKDNDGRTALSLYYRPQSYLYLGGIISLGAIFFSLLTLVFWKEKRHNSNIVQKKENAK